LFDGQHISESALVDYGDGGIMAEGASKFVDVAVEGIAVAWFVPLPYGNHQFGGVNCLAEILCKTMKYPCFEI